MTLSPRHVIKRTVVELTVPGGMERAQALQDEISRVCRDRLAPLLEKHFSRASGPDHILRLDRLELDLGVLDPDDLADDFTARMDRALGQGLEAQGRQAAERENGEESPKARSRLELVTMFLKTGCLPWWADMNRANIFIENLDALLRESTDALAGVLKILIPETAARTRLVRHVDDRMLAAICALYVSSGRTSVKESLPELLKKIRELTGSPVGRGFPPHKPAGDPPPYHPVSDGSAESRFLFWNAFLETAASRSSQNATPETFIRTALRTLSDPPFMALHAEALVQLAGPESQGKDQDHRPGTFSGRAAQTDADPKRPVPSGETRKTPFQPENPAIPGFLDPGFATAMEYPVTNAGLVILWPYLVHFFTHLGLVDETRNFRDGASRHRAAGLLQNVVSGDGEPPEYLLPLNKILCGIGVKDLADLGPPATEAETLECENLVRAVILQAPVLRNMSSGGFRASFLLRDGVLSSRDGMGLLSVEQKTHDIVLARFPWTWEWVRLPWMESPLRVEWE